jgi:hypothetical protein
MSRTAAITAKQMQLFTTMVNEGVAPEDIAKTFGIAVSSVHNYKKKLKNDGVVFPDVRGRRPSGNINSFVDLYNELVEDKGAISNEEVRNSSEKSNEEAEGYKIVINGTQFFISSSAKEVHINGKDSIEVNF